MRSFTVYNLGCKVNAYELSALSSLLIKEGFKEDNQNPDVVLINTCSVTATADQKSRQHIRKMPKLLPNADIAVMGCYAQGNHKFIEEEIKPTILLGTSHRRDVIELIKKAISDGGNYKIIEENTRNFEYEELGITSYTENVRAFLKIQDGCNNFCTYCIVPYRRGKMRSRKKENVIEEAKYLVSKGYQEIVLSGIHVGGYGQDLGDFSFSDLVETLLNINGLKSLRISSIEESEIDDKLIELITSRNNLAKHLHIPLQSGSNHVLKLMNRKYTREQFIDNAFHLLIIQNLTIRDSSTASQTQCHLRVQRLNGILGIGDHLTNQLHRVKTFDTRRNAIDGKSMPTKVTQIESDVSHICHHLF